MPTHRFERAALLMRAGGIAAIGAAALLVAIAIVTAAWMARDGRLKSDSPTFTTNASGTVDVPPSSATTRVGLRACAKGPGEALQVLNGRFGSMSKTWRSLDVPEDDIARGELRTVRETPTRWCSTLDAVVTVEDLDLVDEVLTGITRHSRGIAYLDGPTFDYDTARLEEEALDEAMRVARRKADDAARRSDMRLDGVRRIEEGLVEVTRPEDRGRQQYPYDGYAGGRTATVSASVDMERSIATAVSRNPGRASATVSVEVVFELDD